MIRNITNHIAERALYPDGILYINLEKIYSVKDILILILENLMMSDPVQSSIFRLATLKKTQSNLIHKIIKKLQLFKKKFLFVFDNVDAISGEGLEFKYFINEVVREFSKVQILFSSSYIISGIENY